MALSEREKQELLSFNTGEPIIITPNNDSDEYDEYNIVMFVRTISDYVPNFINSVQLILTFPSDFPNTSPSVNLHKTKLFHPNFTDKGSWINNEMDKNETISEYLIRLIRVIQFKKMNVENIANRNAMAWYNKRKNDDIFPTDRINYNAKPRISIIRVNETIK